MPTSELENVPRVLRLCLDPWPRVLIDVGVGWGKYGALLRESEGWKRRMHIIGVEPWSDYRTPLWDCYTGIVTEAFPCSLPKADVVLMCDVLEHFTPHDGMVALQHALELAPRVVVCTPLGWEQGAVGGNSYERHLSEWSKPALREAARELGAHWTPAPSSPQFVIGTLVR